MEERCTFFFLDAPATEIYTGPWLVGYIAIENTPFYVLVQTRDWVALALFTAALLGLLFSLGKFNRNRTAAANTMRRILPRHRITTVTKRRTDGECYECDRYTGPGGDTTDRYPGPVVDTTADAA